MSVVMLWLPILLSGVALFFASFLSWMVFQWHFADWRKLPDEGPFLETMRKLHPPAGNYMFPGFSTPAELNSPELRQRQADNPQGILTVFGKINMGRNLGLTLLYFLVISFCLAYLGTLALEPGAKFQEVFRFMATAALIVFPSAIVQHAIWFHCRITGHLVESVVYAVIVGVIFGALWPAV